jgi:hypothetical protein
MAVIQVANVPERKRSKREIYANICYYYPQYTLSMVQKLPARDLKLLLDTAKRNEANKLLLLTQIAAAPHTKNGKGVTKLSNYFKSESK